MHYKMINGKANWFAEDYCDGSWMCIGILSYRCLTLNTLLQNSTFTPKTELLRIKTNGSWIPRPTVSAHQILAGKDEPMARGLSRFLWPENWKESAPENAYSICGPSFRTRQLPGTIALGGTWRLHLPGADLLLSCHCTAFAAGTFILNTWKVKS